MVEEQEQEQWAGGEERGETGGRSGDSLKVTGIVYKTNTPIPLSHEQVLQARTPSKSEWPCREQQCCSALSEVWRKIARLASLPHLDGGRAPPPDLAWKVPRTKLIGNHPAPNSILQLVDQHFHRRQSSGRIGLILR